MCGLAGLYVPGRRHGAADLDATALRMADALRHRGPDGGGVWSDPSAGVALAHRRLAVIDLSAEGRQPMTSEDGRHVIVFNGEIYNFRALRADLAAEGRRFRGGSDTEVLLAAVGAWGVERALAASAGMFALALWDRAERTLTLARDRLGKKPLYVGRVGDGLAFASELKAFAGLPGFERTIDEGALALFLRHQYIPAPHTIWRDARKLPAGARLDLRLDGGPAPRDLDGLIRPFWSARDVAERGVAAPVTDEAAALDRLDALLGQAVEERMIADVPLGAFLSGGIDSSLVVALMRERSARPVRTFTIGFDEAGFDEAPAAREVARRLGTDHAEIRVTPGEAREVIPRLAEMYDEPFADPSQIPTWHVARAARAEVTVCLSGDGGDEFFGGYGRYLLADGLERRLRGVPPGLRRAAAALARTVPVGGWDALVRRTGVGAGRVSGDRIHKLAGLVAAPDADARYRALLGVGGAPVLARADAPSTPPTDEARAPRIGEYLHRMMCHDSATYLPDDVLAKVDRASMAVSLEVRAPLLDHRVVEFAWRMPLAMKVRDGRGKWALRRLLERRLPGGPADGGKRGFGIPLADWLRGPLRDWAEPLLAPPRLAEEGLFDAPAVRRLWDAHQTGGRNMAPALWSVLMFQAWRERWGSGAPASDAVAAE